VSARAGAEPGWAAALSAGRTLGLGPGPGARVTSFWAETGQSGHSPSPGPGPPPAPWRKRPGGSSGDPQNGGQAGARVGPLVPCPKTISGKSETAGGLLSGPSCGPAGFRGLGSRRLGLRPPACPCSAAACGACADSCPSFCPGPPAARRVSPLANGCGHEPWAAPLGPEISRSAPRAVGRSQERRPGVRKPLACKTESAWAFTSPAGKQPRPQRKTCRPAPRGGVGLPSLRCMETRDPLLSCCARQRLPWRVLAPRRRQEPGGASRAPGSGSQTCILWMPASETPGVHPSAQDKGCARRPGPTAHASTVGLWATRCRDSACSSDGFFRRSRARGSESQQWPGVGTRASSRERGLGLCVAPDVTQRKLPTAAQPVGAPAWICASTPGGPADRRLAGARLLQGAGFRRWPRTTSPDCLPPIGPLKCRPPGFASQPAPSRSLCPCRAEPWVFAAPARSPRRPVRRPVRCRRARGAAVPQVLTLSLSLRSLHFTRRTACGAPGATGWWSAPGYPSQPLDESWPRQQPPWKEEKLPGFRLASALNRTNSDSALHTSALSAKPQDPFGGGGPPAWPAPCMGFCDGDSDVLGEAPFPGPLREEALLTVPSLVARQLWEAKEVQSLAGRPRSCDAGGSSSFPLNGQSAGLPSLLGALSTGGSLPDLTSLHHASPLPALLDPGDHLSGSVSTGSSMGNLPAAMTHLGLRGSPGLQTSRSNPSIQAALSQTALSSSLDSHPQAASLGPGTLHPALRLFSLSNPSLSTASLSGPPRRRQPPVSPLTLSPGPEAHPGFGRQLSSTGPLNHRPAQQMLAPEQSAAPFLPAEAQVSPPPPYLAAREPLLQHPRPKEPPAPQPPSAASLTPSDFQLLAAQAQGSPVTSFFPDVDLDQLSLRPGPSFAPQVPPAQQGPRELQDAVPLRPSPHSSCGNVPSALLAEDPSASLFRDLSSALAGLPEVSLSVDAPFPLEGELQFEPLSLDGLSTLGDASLGLLDPSVEEAFRADRL
ncbi:CREB-regulated transcription coactivator 3, partial [Galemys pyrenaicus]